MTKIALILVLVLGWSLHAEAEDWPHWRGPSANGISSETELPTHWSDEENIAWRARLRGLGVSSPIVWGDRVIVTSQVGSGLIARNAPPLVQPGATADAERPLGGLTASDAAADPSEGVTFLVTAFDHSSGRQVWEFELPSEGTLPAVHEKQNLASSSPLTDGERIYSWFGTGQIVALDMDGRLIWKRHLGAEYGPFDILWGHSSSPILHQDTLILLCYHNSASYLLGLDARTGEVRWKSDRGRGVFSYSTPLLVESPDGVELIVNSNQGISGHDASTGELRWRLDEDNRFPVPMPIVQDGLIYASRGYRSGPYMAIRPGGRGDVESTHLEWRVGTGAPYMASLVYHEGLLYMIGDIGIMSAVDASTGERVWQERVGGLYYSSPVIAGGKLYAVSETGETVVLETGSRPRVLARNKLDARLLASPAVSRGRLFIRSDDTLFAIGH